MIFCGLGVFVLMFGLATNVISMKVVFERAEVAELNTDFLEWGTIKVQRYGRRSDYYLNIRVFLKYQWNNNVTVHAIFNQYLANEYRRSFIEFHYKFCDMVNSDPYIGKLLANGGLVCPAHPGLHQLVNLTAPTENFPNVFPFEKGRVDVHFVTTTTNVTIFTVHVHSSFQNAKRKTG